MKLNDLPRPERRSLRELEQHGGFVERHIGTTAADQAAMLATLGFESRAALISAIVPEAIREKRPLALPAAMGEQAALDMLKVIARKNRVPRSFIGQGYYGTLTPGVLLRNILENPAWYTAYTPYQPEISQGRLEALINFQTMVCDLTGLSVANASMLDEATAAAEAMTLCQRVGKSKSRVFYVAADVLPQTQDVVRTRATPLGICVGSLQCASRIAYFHAVRARSRRYSSKSASEHFGGYSFHATSKSARACSKVLAVPSMCRPLCDGG